MALDMLKALMLLTRKQKNYILILNITNFVIKFYHQSIVVKCMPNLNLHFLEQERCMKLLLIVLMLHYCYGCIML